jgi:hypothetical protein
MCKRITTTLIVSCITLTIWCKNIIVIDHQEIPRQQKEAILILPGFGSKIQGTKDQKKYFAHKGYDLFIPDYISRKSVQHSVNNINDFIQKNHLQEYSKIHVFGYIVGSWTINTWIQQHPDHNIANIIYDRSPLQERAPVTLVRDRPLLMKIFAGPMMESFSKTPYPPLDKKQIRLGILVESKATNLIRRHKKTALSLGPVRWDTAQFNQDYDDLLYTWLNHDDMYSRFDIIGAEIFHFIQHGRFSDGARRSPFTDDPFMPFLE